MSTCQFRDKDGTLRTFIHIPKTAGQSLTQWIRHHDKNTVLFNMHASATDLISQNIHLGETFTIIRNPYDRVVSTFSYYRANALKQVEQKKTELTTDAELTAWQKQHREAVKAQAYFTSRPFDRWLNECIDDPRKFALVDNSLTEYTKNVNTIFKYEELDQGFKIMENWFNTRLDFPEINISRMDDYRHYYKSEKSKKFVYEYFRKDLERFGYDF
jgi:hypothetical protein